MTSVARQRQRPLQSGADYGPLRGLIGSLLPRASFGPALVGHCPGAFRAAPLSGWALDLPRVKAPALGQDLLQR